MVKQNRQDAERLLERIVREKGEDTTAYCQYSSLETEPGFLFEEGKWVDEHGTLPEEVRPICIVGCAVFEVGGVESLFKMPSDTTAGNVEEVKNLFDEAATNYLNAAQWIQDHEGTWGEALEIANALSDEELREAAKDDIWGDNLKALLKTKLKDLRDSKKG